ncbi:MAG: SDR family oxidoreductase [Clostridia bacterium]|nr:SDR family oxidoreductase [Clostridia bacterium]
MTERKKKTVLVTGGVRGIGKAIATAFLQKGYRVAVTYSKDEENARSCRQEGLEVYRADVRKEEEILALFETLKSVDILVNNAGVSLLKQIQDTTIDEWNELVAVNLTGAFLCSKEAVKGMIAQKSGLIVNISSVWGEVGASCESAYSATKAGLLGFTKALAKELGLSGVRVCSVSPGVIDTQMNKFDERTIELLKEEIPLGKIGLPQDVASAVLFLEENEYVTGVDIPVNGGFSIV